MHWSSEAAKYTNRNSKDIILQQKSSFRIDANFKAVLFLGKKPLLVYFVSYVKTRSHRNFCTFGWTFWITSTRGFHNLNGRHDTIYHPFGGLAICERTPGIYPKRKERGRFAGFASFATTGRPHILSMTDKIGLPRAILWGRKETFSIANDLQSVFLASLYLCYTSRHKAPTAVSRGSARRGRCWQTCDMV